MLCFLDFETRSEVDIKTTGAWVYSEHPSTEVLCLAMAIDNNPTVVLGSNKIRESLLPKFLLPNTLYVAHNAFFEQSIWQNIMVKRYGFPEIPIAQWRCSQAKAAACALPKGLDKLSQALGVSVNKDMIGNRLMLKMCKPRRVTKKDDSKWHETPEDLKRLGKYCKQDVEVMRACWKRLPDLDSTEQKIWFLDQKINHRGVKMDLRSVDSALFLIDLIEVQLKKTVCTATNGAVDNINQIQKVVRWLNDHGVDCADLTKDTVSELLAKDLPEYIHTVLSVRQQLGKTSTKKYRAMKTATANDGRVKDVLQYHSATTGRWGGKLVQFQNLPRGSIRDTNAAIDIMNLMSPDALSMLYSNAMDAISSCLRGMLIAEKSNDLLVADYSAIEARVLLWLCKSEQGLDLYRNGSDLYVDMAKDIYTTEQIDKEKRRLGKTVVLGCGYGMGPRKFKDTCKQQGIVISNRFAVDVVQAYRQKYSRVTAFWREAEQSARSAITNRGETFKVGGQKMFFSVRGPFLVCWLPSGRTIKYYHPSIQQHEMSVEIYNPDTDEFEKKLRVSDQISFWGVNSQTKKFEMQYTYGGKLVENCTQAVARDFMAWAMLRLDEKGYDVVLSIHDELIAENKKDFGSLDEFIQIMEELPPWGGGCPIKAEGWRGERYHK